jgi:hypothetical protein
MNQGDAGLARHGCLVGRGFARSSGVRVWGLIGLLVAAGCATPPPIVSYEDEQLSIRLYRDRRAAGGHAHPILIPPGQFARVLTNLTVSDRQDFLINIFKHSEGERRVFSGAEARLLASLLSKALGEASPSQLVTFHWRLPDVDHVAVVTSGGLFVEGPRLVVMLANYRARPALSYEGITYESDSKEAPLVPFRPKAIRLGFRDATLRAPLDLVADHYRFDDEAQAVTIDLERLALAGEREVPGGNPEQKRAPN